MNCRRPRAGTESPERLARLARGPPLTGQRAGSSRFTNFQARRHDGRAEILSLVRAGRTPRRPLEVGSRSESLAAAPAAEPPLKKTTPESRARGPYEARKGLTQRPGCRPGRRPCGEMANAAALQAAFLPRKCRFDSDHGQIDRRSVVPPSQEPRKNRDRPPLALVRPGYCRSLVRGSDKAVVCA